MTEQSETTKPKLNYKAITAHIMSIGEQLTNKGFYIFLDKSFTAKLKNQYSPRFCVDLNQYVKQIIVSRSYNQTNLPQLTYNERFKLESRFEDVRRYLNYIADSILDPTKPSRWTDDETGLTYLNLYRPYKPTAESTSPKLWLNFLKRLVPDDTQREVVTWWLAQLVQQPEIRPTWGLVAPSEKGTGKGYFYENLICRLTGDIPAIQSNLTNLLTYNQVWSDALVICVDDLATPLTVTQTNKLKGFIANNYATIRRMQIAGQGERLYSRFLCTDNFRAPLTFDSTERRFYVVDYIDFFKKDGDITDKQNEASDYLVLLDNDPSGFNSFYEYLKSYDLSKYSPFKLPRSGKAKEMANDALDEFGQVLQSYITECESDWFEKDNLLTYFETVKYGYNDSRDSSKLTNRLKRLGYKSHRSTSKVNGVTRHIRIYYNQARINLADEVVKDDIVTALTF
ncbi:primase-helicase family protein [Photobacterium phosphoreum]|uniref:primase-helicase family protein n=1 Tax=Photobacterium phosphoreum TaxID=659 RepID=UPI000D17836B|nr:primase-helicase family protein [Photobacterium phosphoreum]PSU73706.1 hypothetical protein CTM67_19655 [Photobacterium phosphoreum]